jgi:hypothetical protein
MANTLTGHQKRLVAKLRKTLLAEGWQPGSLLEEELKPFKAKEAGRPALAELLPPSRSKGCPEQVESALCGAWLIGSRKRAVLIQERLKEKVTLANSFTSAPIRSEHRRETRVKLNSFFRELEAGEHPQKAKRLEEARRTGNPVLVELVKAEITRDLASNRPGAKLTRHPELLGSTTELYESIKEIHSQVPGTQKKPGRGAPRVPHAVLAPVIEKQYAHLHAAERTRVLIALMDKYFPGESTPTKMSAYMRALRSRRSRIA